MEHFGGPVAYLLDLVYRTLPPMCGAFILIDSVEIILKELAGIHDSQRA